MLKKSWTRLCFGMSSYGHTHNGTLAAGTKVGIPFYGNMYQGRVNPEDYQPSQYSTREEARHALLTYNKVYADDDPYIRAKLDKCPYFALADLVVWHGMAPTFLDPGLLTSEEHHLLLLWSRAYFEKWTEIHSNPREVAPKPRIKKGRFNFCEKVFKWAGCNEHQIKRARDLLIDDASFIGMNPKCWGSAHLDEKVRDHLTGRCLEFAGLTETQMQDIFELLDRMRTIVVRRKDRGAFDPASALTGIVDHSAPAVEDLASTSEFSTLNYVDGYTLFNLYKSLGLQSYSGQLKIYSYVDRIGTPLTITLNNEDDYFDFLVANFYKANVNITSGSTSPFVITVVEQTRAQAAMGKWF